MVTKDCLKQRLGRHAQSTQCAADGASNLIVAVRMNIDGGNQLNDGRQGCNSIGMVRSQPFKALFVVLESVDELWQLSHVSQELSGAIVSYLLQSLHLIAPILSLTKLKQFRACCRKFGGLCLTYATQGT